ncbi:hypothetical protein ABIE87_006495 [Bradyrhizobium diazoefficiens]|uniref:hypothetical protein n=1 Tax=Bradyrhizobium diazoefficiens TaxID=1355477 RepID=UPI003517FD18
MLFDLTGASQAAPTTTIGIGRALRAVEGLRLDRSGRRLGGFDAGCNPIKCVGEMIRAYIPIDPFPIRLCCGPQIVSDWLHPGWLGSTCEVHVLADALHSLSDETAAEGTELAVRTHVVRALLSGASSGTRQL